jgi:hypothetical protein
MVKLISITESDKPEKKLKAIFLQSNGRKLTIHFGAKGMDDYTLTHSKEQRTMYLQRHKKREDWTDPTSAGALSRWILWGESTNRDENISAFKRRFNLL